MKTKRRQVTIFALVLIGVVLAGVAWASHGYFWSLREIRYKKLLNSLPEPPGWISATDHLDTDAYSPFGFRYYEVNGSYEEVVDFFRSEIPKLGLLLLLEEEHGVHPSTVSDNLLLSTSLFFAYHRNDCVSIFILTETDEDGIPVGDWTKINIMIVEETEHPDCRRFAE